MLGRVTAVCLMKILKAFLLFLCTGCAVASGSSTPSKPKASLVNQAVVVQVAKVINQPIPIYVNALGSLSAVNSVTISTETAGRVAAIFFSNGQQVGKDMPIMKLDDSEAKANYNSAVTTLDLSRRNYQRAKLLPAGTMAQQNLDQLKATVDNNDSVVKKDLAILNQQTVTAPFSGVLGSFGVQVGDYVSAGDPIVTLVNTHLLRVNFSVPQDKVSRLKLSQLVNVTVDAYPGKTFFGTVSFISPSVSDTTRAVQVQAMVQNKSNELYPGMFCQVEQQIGINNKALVIPHVAVNADIKGYYVYKVDGTQVVKVYVTPGTTQKNMVQITQGLKLSDEVVIAGQQKLQDGSNITISNNDSGK